MNVGATLIRFCNIYYSDTNHLIQSGLDIWVINWQSSDKHEGQLLGQIGLKWKDLARELGLLQAPLIWSKRENCTVIRNVCIELLVRWMRQNETEATVGILTEALEKIELKNVADNLISDKQERWIAG